MIEYKVYFGVIDFDPDIDLFHGTVINTQDVITFYGSSVVELREEMQKSLEVYFKSVMNKGKYQIYLFQVYFLFESFFQMSYSLRSGCEDV